LKSLWFLVFSIVGLNAAISRAATADAPTILVFGDSISAGYGLPRVEDGWVELLRKRLKEQGYGYSVVNASVSGETTAGGVARLPRALDLHHPQIVIVELGGNDGLRALPVPQMRANIAKMTDLSETAGSRVVLLGMRMPPNYGPSYTEQFFAVYADVAHEKKTALVPFLLDGIALDANLVQADDIHPNAVAQPKLLDNVWTALKPLLKK
jgi:acyl-CoA thioesterase-1